MVGEVFLQKPKQLCRLCMCREDLQRLLDKLVALLEFTELVRQQRCTHNRYARDPEPLGYQH